MASTSSLAFKIATEPAEFEQIHRLNYKTFVGEIPQHAENDEQRLIDRFDGENTYIICLDDARIVGMLTVRGKRPFSLDYKLKNLDSYLPRAGSICEIRLLAVEQRYRHSRVFLGLARELFQYWTRNGYDMAVISGALRQLHLYRNLGFTAFGPVVGTQQAPYQPMYITKESLEKNQVAYRRLDAPPVGMSSLREMPPISFLPGPVRIQSSVRKTFGDEPVSHRSTEFVADFQEVRRQLCRLAQAEDVQILLGSGTLGNDVVAAQLSLLDAPGLIVTNGEFGERLVDQGSRFQLKFQTLKYPWGDAFNYDEIRAALDASPQIKWLWTLHCETSSGMLNDMAQLKQICAPRDVRLCLDCCSSLGVVPVDLGGVYLASSGSGKGLGSYAGLSMVFHHHQIAPNPRLPRYLDLGLYAANQGVAFTHSSNLVYALHTALRRFEDDAVFGEVEALGKWLRQELRRRGFNVIGADATASPGIVTIALRQPADSAAIGAALERAGYLLNYRSGYLLDRGWLQISLMGEHSKPPLHALLDELDQYAAR